MIVRRTHTLIVAWICFAGLLHSTMAADTNGTRSKEELAKLYQRYFALKDSEKLSSLVYWPGVMPPEREAFNRSLRYDFTYRVRKIEFSEIDKSQKLEYTIGGSVFRPTLPPVARMVVSYEGHGDVKNPSTTYLIGKKENRYYMTLASPVPK